MSMTKVQVISNALMMLGKRPIITLDNQDALTTSAEQMFDFNMPAILSTGFLAFRHNYYRTSNACANTDWRILELCV